MPPDRPVHAASLTRRGFLGAAAVGAMAVAAGCTPSPSGEVQRAAEPSSSEVSGPRFVRGVSDDRRMLVDGDGRPVLGLADAVWTMPAVYTPSDLAQYFSARRTQGFTALHTAVWPFHFRGEKQVNGCVDGVQAFFDGDISRWNEKYWRRVDQVFDQAAEHGITVVAGVMAPDLGYTLDVDLARSFGAQIGERYQSYPNLVWLFGVDYAEQDWVAYDPILLACLDGIRGAGDEHLTTIQFHNDDSLSHDNPRWRGLTQIEAAYTYRPAYTVIRHGYELGTGPVILVESSFEDENNQGGPPTVDATIRRQALWTYTSGGVHVAYGRKDVWRSDGDFLARLESTAVHELGLVHAKLESLDWTRLVPDLRGEVLVAGAGTDVTRGTQEGGFADPLESDLATCAATPDGSLVVVYVPTARTVTLAPTALDGELDAHWWDPTTGSESDAVPRGRSFTTPGAVHQDGRSDWLLVVRQAATPSP